MGKLMIVLFFVSGFFSSHNEVSDEISVADKTLVIYLSRTNNTKAIAEMIHQKVGGDIEPLELVNPYPEDYDAIVEQVKRENEKGFLPPLKTKIDLLKYDTVFIGFPTWSMRLPPPMESFLTFNNLDGKTVIPFNTNAGYGVGSSFETVKSLCKGCNTLEGFSTEGGIERDGVLLAIQGDQREQTNKEVNLWLSKITIKQ